MVKQAKCGPRVVPVALLTSLYQAGCSVRSITSQLADKGFEVSRSGVHKRLSTLCAQGRLQKQNTTKKLSSRDHRMLSRLIRINNIRTAPQLQKELASRGVTASRSTVWRALKKDPNLCLQRPRKKQFMTHTHCKARLAWARTAVLNWNALYFGDEKAFDLDGPAWRPRIWCDKRDPPPVLPRRGKQQSRVVLFGCFSRQRAPALVQLGQSFKSADYCKTVSKVLHAGDKLLHDRHPVHKSKETTEYMRVHMLDSILLPPKAADINPIENLWAIIVKRVYKGCKVYNTTAALWAAIQDAWKQGVQKDAQLRRNLIGSMPRRLAAVIAQKGGYTRY
jgi:arginine repressor